MITLAYCCGLRLGEILHLTWSDLDFEARLVRIARRGRKGSVEAWCPKDKDMRSVPLPESAVNLLTRLQLEAVDGQMYVFVTAEGPSAGARVKRQNISRDFHAIRRRAAVPKCKFHEAIEEVLKCVDGS